MRGTHLIAIFLTALIGAAAPARAGGGDDTDGDGAIVVAPIDVHGKRPAGDGPGALVTDDPAHADAARATDDPAFATVVHIDDHAGETTSVAEVLSRTAGVRVRSLGGLGGYSSIAVRGHASGHTAVFVDGVPLSRLASVSADLGRFDLGSFSSLELYRGGVPVSLGGAALGGALVLHTGVGPGPKTVRVSMGAGSFGARHLRARWLGGRADGSLGYQLSAGYTGTTGDFAYFDDNGTNLNPSDDEMVRRSNNGYDRVDAVARVRAVDGPLTVEAGTRTLAERQGVPGSATVQSLDASLETVGQLADVTVRRRHLLGSAGASGVLSGWASFERQRYRDLANEVGVGTQDRRYRSISAGARGAVTIARGAHLIRAGVDAAADYYDDRDLLDGGRRRAYGGRLRAGVSLADEWLLGAGERVVLQPALRLDAMVTDPVDDNTMSIVGPVDVTPRRELFPSPRLAARVRVADDLAIKGSAGWYYRAPTLLEIFGDRGFTVGNPGLDSETGTSADVGAVLAPLAPVARSVDRLYVEAAGFGSLTRNTIVQVPTAGLATVATNLGDAFIWGGELTASSRFARTATVTASYTYTDSRQQSTLPSYEGKRLPQRPRHLLDARIDVARRWWHRLAVLWVDSTLASGNYLDAANLRAVPARALFGAGIKLEPVPGLLVGVEVKNLTDERVEDVRLDPAPRPDLTRAPRAISDFFGYPLPGRAVYVTVEWSR